MVYSKIKLFFLVKISKNICIVAKLVIFLLKYLTFMQHFTQLQQQIYVYYQKNRLLSGTEKSYYVGKLLEIERMSEKEYAKAHFAISKSQMTAVLAQIIAEAKE